MKYNVTVVFPDGNGQTYSNLELHEIVYSEANKTVWIFTEYVNIRYVGFLFYIQAFKN